MRMSVDEFRHAIEAAYVEGYVNGVNHPASRRILTKATELAHLFWRTIELRIAEQFPDSASVAVPGTTEDGR